MDEIWYSYSVITNQIILNSFKCAGINSSGKGSQDDQFIRYEDLNKKNEIIELENKETLVKEDYLEQVSDQINNKIVY